MNRMRVSQVREVVEWGEATVGSVTMAQVEEIAKVKDQQKDNQSKLTCLVLVEGGQFADL